MFVFGEKQVNNMSTQTLFAPMKYFAMLESWWITEVADTCLVPLPVKIILSCWWSERV